jgi:hypothetical protein
MKLSRLSIFFLLGIFLLGLANPAQAQAGVTVVSDTVTLAFPDTATFQAEFTSGANITSVVLEYGTDQLTCGSVVAKAFPAVTAAADVKVQWTWQMQQSGSLPPGATVWWQWLVEDASGAKFTSPKQTAIWLDSVQSWQTITGGNINLHYYNGGQNFGQSLHDAAAAALVRLTQDVGLGTDKPVDIYIYASYSDMQAAVLFQPDWAGGLAFPEDNIVILGVSTDLLTWGEGAEAHELTHVLVGHLTFTCLGSIPTWLNEGLAMYGQGGPLPEQVTLLDQAKASNTLPALSSLAGAFPEDSNRANLAYTESYSVVNYLITTYGRDKMTALLLALRNGDTIEAALQPVFGFDTNGLEDAWRLSIGASPRPGTTNPTPAATPTQVPTFVPVGASSPASSNPTALPTQALPPTYTPPVAQPTSPGETATATPLLQQLGIGQNVVTVFEFGCIGCILVILVLGVPIYLTTRRHSRRRK